MHADYVRSPIPAGPGAPDKALDLFLKELGKLPRCAFILNNYTKYDLNRDARNETIGGWPLGNVGKKECIIAAGLDRLTLSVAAEYSVSTDNSKKISLAGSSLPLLKARIGIFKGKNAKDAYSALRAVSIDHDSSGNEAYVTNKEDCCIFIYGIRNMEHSLETELTQTI